MGVPRIVDGRSQFCPPEQIARDEPYVLFLDELNAAAPGRAEGVLLADPRPAHRLLRAAGRLGRDRRRATGPPTRRSPGRWRRRWSTGSCTSTCGPPPPTGSPGRAGNGIHPWILEYLTQRPDHLWCAPPKTEEPFSTPRGWHMLSDVLHSYGEADDDDRRAARLRHAHPAARRRLPRLPEGRPARATTWTRSSRATRAGRPRRATATCCTSSPRRSAPGWPRTCRPTGGTRRRRCGSSRTGRRRCSSSWPRSPSRSRSW